MVKRTIFWCNVLVHHPTETTNKNWLFRCRLNREKRKPTRRLFDLWFPQSIHNQPFAPSFTVKYCTQSAKKYTPEDWRLEHNSLEVWFWSFSFLNGWFVGSMLIFQGVTFLFKQQSWTNMEHVLFCEHAASNKSNSKTILLMVQKSGFH